MNKEYFRYLVKSRGYSVAEFSKALGLKQNVLNYKLRTGTFNIKEVRCIIVLLNKTFEEIFVD